MSAVEHAIRAGSPDFHNDVITLVAQGDHAAARLRGDLMALREQLG